MPEHLTIASFKYGIDTRKSELTDQPGSLTQCNNAHINQGGEVEKRKAFVLLGQLPATCQGLQETSSGLVTYGSQVQGATGVNDALGNPVVYEQLKPDTQGLDVTPNNLPSIDSVLCSCAFGGKDFVAVHWTAFNGSNLQFEPCVAYYYAGQLITQGSIGQVNFVTTSGIYTPAVLQAQSLALHFPEYFTTGFIASSHLGQTTIQGPVDQIFTITIESANGTIVQTTPGAAAGAVTAVAASTTIVLQGNSGTFYLGCYNQVVNAISGAYQWTKPVIIGQATWDTNLQITSGDLVNSINKAGAQFGYSATLSATAPWIITVYAPIAAGALFNTPSTNLFYSSTGTLLLNQGSSTVEFSGGVNANGPVPQVSVLDYTTTAWPLGSSWQLTFESNNIDYTIGAGNLAGLSPTACMALGNKLYLMSNSQFNFSKIGDCTRWENQDTGAGFVPVNDLYAAPSPVLACASYQGMLALFSRWNIQVYGVNADPSQYYQKQSLQNIGTYAPRSVQAIGDMDVLFLADTGVRSLRVRDSSLNATVVDVGSAIDSLIQSAAASAADKGVSACGIVDPTTNHYWLYLNGTIYVLSFYPSLKIVAWSTYSPTYQDPITQQQVAFTPAKFLIYAGQVYCLTTDNKVIVYGGVGNQVYDNCIASGQSSWLDLKSPYQDKTAEYIDAAFEGEWQVECGMDAFTQNTQPVIPFNLMTAADSIHTDDATYGQELFGFNARGRHWGFKFYTSPNWTGYAVFSSITLQYDM